ncbi:hypothetical protein [Janibacter melonis]|uniref:hypothetical protein n=1 Tax=Janibacter melonis TaxID=262209 RepID=UPI00178716B0
MSAGDLYVVWGYLAGRLLPPGFLLGDPAGDDWFKIIYNPTESFLEIPQPGLVEVESPGGTWIAGTGRRLRVKSPAVFQIPVRVEDPDLAMRTVEKEVLPRRLASISAMMGSPVYAAPIAFHLAGQPEEWLPRPNVAQLEFLLPGFFEATPADLEDWGWLVWAADNDATARQAAGDLYLADHHLHCQPSDIADTSATLLKFFFVIERIANKVTDSSPLTPDPSQVDPTIRRLEAGLEGANDLPSKVAHVRRAAQQLQALHSRGMARRVRDAGELIGLDSLILEEARELVDLRHATLGHVASQQDSGELVGWLPRAQYCAHAFLAAYLGWVRERGIADPN